MTVTEVNVNPASSGTVVPIAVDELVDRSYPIHKPAFGAEGAATLVSTSNPLPVVNVPGTENGVSPFKNLDVDETEDAIKASTGKLYRLDLFNLHASALRYVKLYDATVATVVVGTTVPVLTVPVVAGTHVPLLWPDGLEFGTAITIAATTGLADNDTGAPGANEVVACGAYK